MTFNRPFTFMLAVSLCAMASACNQPDIEGAWYGKDLQGRELVMDFHEDRTLDMSVDGENMEINNGTRVSYSITDVDSAKADMLDIHIVDSATHDSVVMLGWVNFSADDSIFLHLGAAPGKRPQAWDAGKSLKMGRKK